MKNTNESSAESVPCRTHSGLARQEIVEDTNAARLRAGLTRVWKRLIGDWWEIRVCYWPHPRGYATYNPYRKTILDTGLSREQAKEICKELNGLK